MTEASIPAVWMEKSDGERIPVKGNCSFGRSPSNEIILPDERVSRRHAIIHEQEQNEFWLVDLGSRNGTYLNGRRVFQPTRLNEADRIDIGHFSFIFHQHATAQALELAAPTDEKTIADVKPLQCWLLVADIIGSTRLNQTMSAEEISVMVGGWLAECKQISEECGAVIDKYLGDGFLAYWHAREMTGANIVRAMAAFKRLQALERPPFRIVLHHGQVFTGGVASFGHESLFGQEVNFAFRMEKLAATLGETRLVSQPAFQRLQPNFPAVELGQYSLAGIAGQHLFLKY